jgi:DNA (cytosine-5)-methyltransferase 1
MGLFSGAGGLDLGFELAGFNHTQSNEILQTAVDTLRFNRPDWSVVHDDICNYYPNKSVSPDVLLAGFPCQGFSLGGHRESSDTRNQLYKQVIRIADTLKPRVIVMENVLNLRTMLHPETKQPFAEQIRRELAEIGYETKYSFFKVAHYGVPQTRRRFIFVAYSDPSLRVFSFPEPGLPTPAHQFLHDLARDVYLSLPNHNPRWGFKSHVHEETGVEFNPDEPVIPVRFSRTASDGNPVRSLDHPFPAMDTATVWGWAQGHVTCTRIMKDRSNAKFVRSPDATAKLWRISASRLRGWTAREYARLQTFPDSWTFSGKSKRDLQLQIGNAVPVAFARTIAEQVMVTLRYVDGDRSALSDCIGSGQLSLAV